MSGTKELLRRGVGEFKPMPDAFERVLARRDRKQRNRRIGSAVVALVVVGATVGGLLRAFSTGPVPVDDPRSAFLGTWVGTDADGSSQTMTILASGDEETKIVVRDDSATVCSGTPSTMTGYGQVVGDTELVVPSPTLTCDDGSEPGTSSGPPLEEQLHNMTFVLHPRTDTLTDNFGLVWERNRGVDQEPANSGDMWPQSSLDEVRRAQELADAGDARYTWQVDAQLKASPGDAELFDRYLQEQLGWAEFRPTMTVDDPDTAYAVDFIRCAPGGTLPPDPNDPEHGCAPTIDEVRYETVRVLAKQLARRGSSGIWVVTGREARPTVMAPPSDAEATQLLEAFLQARVAGEGAEQYLHSPQDGEMIPLLYVTSSGAPYERSEFEQEQSSVWPIYPVEFKVRLFAEGGGTVVEQFFTMEREQNGRLALGYSDRFDHTHGTKENEQPVAEPYSRLDGEVTFDAVPPWAEGCCFGPWSLYLDDNVRERFYVMTDPYPVETGCRKGPAPADAEALARSIRSDPDLESTAPVALRVGGTRAVRMDVTAARGASACDWWGAPLVVKESGAEEAYASIALGGASRMRLYLLDLPEGSSARILAIAIVAPQARFESVVASAAPIVDSLEFHTQ